MKKQSRSLEQNDCPELDRQQEGIVWSPVTFVTSAIVRLRAGVMRVELAEAARTKEAADSP